MSARTVSRLLRLTVALALAGCASPAPEGTLNVDCSGKCDGIGDELRSIWQDARNVDVGDLVNVGAGLATDGLNDALAFEGGAIELSAPELYASSDVAAGDLSIRDLDALSAGLAARYGERELTVAVNDARRRHLASSGDRVFAESAFSISAEVDPDWRLESGGFGAGDAVATLGFEAGGSIESRVIAAFDSESRASGGALLAALQESRGFVLPRDVADLRAMAPGESFALSGQGALGVNVGAGVPLLLAQPTAAVGYQLVLSASLRTRIEGQLDVQAVRLEGDTVIVDVGTSNVRSREARLALTDGWGVSGFVNADVSLAGHQLDLGRAVERALESRLNRSLDLIEASVERTGRRSRVTVARFSFSLDALGPDGEQALAQALRGDVRLAQALANQEAPGVVAELDLLRSGVSATSAAGIEILGMRFFREQAEASGTTVVQTPGGVRTLMFDSLRRERGWFFSTHGYQRVGLAGLVFDPSRPGAAQGEANLFVDLVEGDDFMERDKMLDHVDALIVAVAGEAALGALEERGNLLEVSVEAQCSPSSGSGDPCRTEVLTAPGPVALREGALADFDAAISGFDEGTRDFLHELAVLRLTAQITVEPAAALVGPQASIVMGYRLDDGALASLLLDHGGEDLSAAVYAYLRATEIDRSDAPARIASDRAALASEDTSRLAARFEDAAFAYEALVSIERAEIEGLGQIGANAIEIRVPVDADAGPRYAEASARSLARARSALFTDLFDDLVSDAGRLGRHPEQTVGYALLGLVERERLDLRVDLEMDLSNRFAQGYEHYRAAGYAPLSGYVRGSRVDAIDGGLFDIDALLTVD